MEKRSERSGGKAKTQQDKHSDTDRERASHGQQERRPARDMSDFDARPRDLSRDALSWRGVEAKAAETQRASSRIFAQKRFSQLSLQPRLTELLEKPKSEGGLALSSCTTVQALTIPAVCTDKKNVLIKSQTGSGKTLAYLLPVIHELMSLPAPVDRNEGTRALVIAPTRELCAQISDVLQRVTQCCVRVVGGSISGGEKKKSEKARLRKGVVVLVGTPGRLLDHVRSTEAFNLTKLRFVILDEIDRLLDMGFEQTVLEILSRIRGEKLPGLKENAEKNVDAAFSGKEGSNTGKTLTKKWAEQRSVFQKKCASPGALRYLMASATLTQAVKQLAWPIMGAGFAVVDGDAGEVTAIESETQLNEFSTESRAKVVGTISFIDEGESAATDEKLRTTLSAGEVVGAPSKLSQFYMLSTAKWRLAALLSFLYLRRDKKIIVFFSTCDSVDFHALLFKEMQWPLDLDGDKDGENKEQEAVDVTANDFNVTAYEQQLKTPSKGKDKQSRTLDPLDWKFNGVFGADCPMYRLHGKVPQHYRKQVRNDFSAVKSGVMLCTDVAARGLDLEGVDWILQYDPPCETTDYVHRVGRTARKGLSGSALTMLLPSEAMYVNLLASHSLTLSPMSSQSMFYETASVIPGAQRFKNKDEMVAVILQRRVERVVSGNKPLSDAAAQAFRAYVRAYATHSADTKGIFKVQSLHLGHVAKSFAMRDKPTDIAGKQGVGLGDVIGRIFNGEFASKQKLAQMKQQALEREKNLAEKKTNNKLKKSSSTEEFSDDSDAGEDSEEDEEEENEGNADEKDEDEMDEVSSAEDAGESEEQEQQDSSDALSSQAEALLTAQNKLKSKKKTEKKADKAPASISNGRTWTTSRAESVLGKRKLSFGKVAVKVAPSGKFRKSGGYFRKKLRSQMSSEFSAN